MMDNLTRINRYSVGRKKVVAVLNDRESACPLINNSDLVEFLNSEFLDFNDDSNEIVSAIKNKGYYIYSDS
jgi:hypothetical protein